MAGPGPAAPLLTRLRPRVRLLPEARDIDLTSFSILSPRSTSSMASSSACSGSSVPTLPRISSRTRAASAANLHLARILGP